MYICEEPDPNLLDLLDASLPFGGKLDRNNRWLRLAHTMNWQEWERSYAKLFAAAAQCALGNEEKIRETIIGQIFIADFPAGGEFERATAFLRPSFDRGRAMIVLRQDMGQPQDGELANKSNEFFISPHRGVRYASQKSRLQ